MLRQAHKGASGASSNATAGTAQADDHAPIKDGLKIGLQAFAIFTGFALIAYATAQNLF